MNPLTNVKNIAKLSETELRLGLTGKSSWHSMYNHSAWIFVGGLNFELTEGDIICVFSQYGEITEINLVKDKESGKSKGFCFICYEDQRSTILAVDNLNGIKLVGRTIRVDHCGNYETPEEREKKRQKERQKRDNERGSIRDTKSKDEIEIKIEVKRDVERDSRRDKRYTRDFRRESEKDRKYSIETRDTRDTRTGTEYQERDRRRDTKYSERDRRRDGHKKGGREKH